MERRSVSKLKTKKEMIGLIGSGSWATAVAKILLEQEEEKVCWWVREPEIRESLAASGINITDADEFGLR